MTSAFLIGGTKSGSGKTTVTLGIMAALKARGIDIQPFKCGPDFIDPSLHKMITNKTSSNLDVKMCGGEFCEETFYNKSRLADVSVIEGVMGLFDGGEGSGAHLAEKLGISVILVVDVRSTAESVAAIVHGFESYSKSIKVVGVILNFVGSARHKELIENEVNTRCNAKIIGFLPRNSEIEIPSRHLGLHMGDELKNTFQPDTLINHIEEHLDLDLLLDLTTHNYPISNDKLNESREPEPDIKGEVVNLAVAKDEAFSFYYEDNFKILKDSGINIIFFSPLLDQKLPDNIHGIYFGGGYPELFAEKLSTNGQMLQEIKTFSENGGIVYGECGGFIYLTEGLRDEHDIFHPLVGALPFQAHMQKKLRRLGYREVMLSEDCILGKNGTLLYGHEFHYSDVELKGDYIKKVYDVNGQKEGYSISNTIGSYVHLHFAKGNVGNVLFNALLKYKREL